MLLKYGLIFITLILVLIASLNDRDQHIFLMKNKYTVVKKFDLPGTVYYIASTNNHYEMSFFVMRKDNLESLLNNEYPSNVDPKNLPSIRECGKFDMQSFELNCYIPFKDTYLVAVTLVGNTTAAYYIDYQQAYEPPQPNNIITVDQTTGPLILLSIVCIILNIFINILRSIKPATQILITLVKKCIKYTDPSPNDLDLLRKSTLDLDLDNPPSIWDDNYDSDPEEVVQYLSHRSIGSEEP